MPLPHVKGCQCHDCVDPIEQPVLAGISYRRILFPDLWNIAVGLKYTGKFWKVQFYELDTADNTIREGLELGISLWNEAHRVSQSTFKAKGE